MARLTTERRRLERLALLAPPDRRSRLSPNQVAQLDAFVLAVKLDGGWTPDYPPLPEDIGRALIGDLWIEPTDTTAQASERYRQAIDG